jgi:hypothetical protein
MLAAGAPRQSRQQAAVVVQRQAVESGDQSPHSKRAMSAMSQKLYDMGRDARAPGVSCVSQVLMLACRFCYQAS